MILIIIGDKGSGKTYCARSLTQYSACDWRDDLNYEELVHNQHGIFKSCGAGETVILCIDSSLSKSEKVKVFKLLQEWSGWLTVCIVSSVNPDLVQRFIHEAT